MPRTYWTYILASRRRRIEIGVTGDLLRCIRKRRARAHGAAAHRMTMLVYFESAPSAREAIARQRELAGWRREETVALIEAWNAQWLDLAADRAGAAGTG